MMKETKLRNDLCEGESVSWLAPDEFHIPRDVKNSEVAERGEFGPRERRGENTVVRDVESVEVDEVGDVRRNALDVVV